MSLKPQTRYTKTSDGVSIAYSVIGAGVPLLFSFPMSHQILMIENPVLRPWFEGLARRYQLVVFDSRGTGLSQRDVAWTTEAYALDVEAVVDSLSLQDAFVFAPIGYGHGAIAIAFQVRPPDNPDRVASGCSCTNRRTRSASSCSRRLVRSGKNTRTLARDTPRCRPISASDIPPASGCVARNRLSRLLIVMGRSCLRLMSNGDYRLSCASGRVTRHDRRTVMPRAQASATQRLD
jgi:pimeloyl-ACP methyl ester carboxylesterase